MKSSVSLGAIGLMLMPTVLPVAVLAQDYDAIAIPISSQQAANFKAGDRVDVWAEVGEEYATRYPNSNTDRLMKEGFLGKDMRVLNVRKGTRLVSQASLELACMREWCQYLNFAVHAILKITVRKRGS